MSYIVDGMVSMLRHGVARPDMDFAELQAACSEPDLHEFDELDEMLSWWEEAKIEYAATSGSGQETGSDRC